MKFLLCSSGISNRSIHAALVDLRGLLTGTPVGGNAAGAVAWSVGIALVSYLWARHLYTQKRSA